MKQLPPWCISTLHMRHCVFTTVSVVTLDFQGRFSPALVSALRGWNLFLTTRRAENKSSFSVSLISSHDGSKCRLLVSTPVPASLIKASRLFLICYFLQRSVFHHTWDYLKMASKTSFMWLKAKKKNKKKQQLALGKKIQRWDSQSVGFCARPFWVPG